MLAPAVLDTVTGPVVAPNGTVAVIWVEESTVNEAWVPLKVTDDTFRKLKPEMVTEVPMGPTVGEIPVTLGPLPNGRVDSVKLDVEVAPQLSVAVTVMVKVPLFDGLADTTPVTELTVSVPA